MFDKREEKEKERKKARNVLITYHPSISLLLRISRTEKNLSCLVGFFVFLFTISQNHHHH